MRVLVTGSNGLIGSSAVRYLHQQGVEVYGLDNDSRAEFFGPVASTRPVEFRLKEEIPGYKSFDIDISNRDAVFKVVANVGPDAVVHCAAQPSHDWAARDVFRDYEVNATGTLNMLEAFHRHGLSGGVFVHLSTNKVYGDRPNLIPLVEAPTRYQPAEGYKAAVNESMSVDASTHSFFGASKLAADVYAQEYGKYYGMRTIILRGGCLTGPAHAGAELHGFLAYVMRATVRKIPYTVYGYKGKQVRDNIHSEDVASIIWSCLTDSTNVAPGEVFNIGGEWVRSCSVIEAIQACEYRAGRSLQYEISDTARIGDHKWYVTDMKKFRAAFPKWEHRYSLGHVFDQLYDSEMRKLNDE